jgi:hypothetical protein
MSILVIYILVGLLIIFTTLLIASFFNYFGMVYGFVFGAPYVPTKMPMVKQMVDLANIKKGEIVFDPACGDGRILHEAEKKGAKCIGVEVTPQIYFLAKWRKRQKKSNAEIRLGSMFGQKDFRKADVIFIYTSPFNMKKFYKLIFPKLKKGTRIISHAFTFKNLEPIKIISKKEIGHDAIYLYVR